MQTALLILPFLALAADPPAPIELKVEELAALSRPDAPGRGDVLKAYHDKPLRLTGSVTWSESRGFLLHVPVPSKPKTTAVFSVRFADPREAETVKQTIQTRAARGMPTSGTLTGTAQFVVDVEKPSPEYVVPKELQPKPKPRPSSETLQEAADRLQAELVEESARQEAILADAKRKKQTVTTRTFELRGIVGAKVEKQKP